MRLATRSLLARSVPAAVFLAAVSFAATAPLPAQVVLSASVDRSLSWQLMHGAASPATVNASVTVPFVCGETQPLDLAPSTAVAPPWGDTSNGRGLVRIRRPNATRVEARIEMWARNGMSYPEWSSASVQGSLLLTLTAPTTVRGALVLGGSLGQGVGPWSSRLRVDLGDDGTIERDTSWPTGPNPQPFLWSVELTVGPTPTRVRLLVDGNSQGSWADSAKTGCELDLTFDPALLGSVTSIGQGCSGGGHQAPVLVSQANALPRQGQPFTFEVAPLPATAGPTFAFLGLEAGSSGGLPLPADLGWLGMPGCTQYLDPLPGVLAFAHHGTHATLTLPLPAIVGLSFYTQALVVVPGANPLGALVTNAARCDVGG